MYTTASDDEKKKPKKNLRKSTTLTRFCPTPKSAKFTTLTARKIRNLRSRAAPAVSGAARAWTVWTSTLATFFQVSSGAAAVRSAHPAAKIDASRAGRRYPLKPYAHV